MSIATRKRYRSVQLDYRQTCVQRAISSQLQIQNRVARRIISITEADLWEFQQNLSQYRCRFSLLNSNEYPLQIQLAGSNRVNFVIMSATTALNDLSGRERTHKHKQICRIVPGLGECQTFVYVFFSGHSLWGRKTHKQNPPLNSGTIPGKFCLCDFVFMCFFSQI